VTSHVTGTSEPLLTTLRGLKPPATPEEIEASARQYICKVSGITRPSAATSEVFEQVVAAITRVATQVLRELPQRHQPPKAVLPCAGPRYMPAWLRRPAQVRTPIPAVCGGMPIAC
jgi:hypothetical protein